MALPLIQWLHAALLWASRRVFENERAEARALEARNHQDARPRWARFEPRPGLTPCPCAAVRGQVFWYARTGCGWCGGAGVLSGRAWEADDAGR